MATHSSILAWKIPWTKETGGLQSTGSQSWTQLSEHTHRTFEIHAVLFNQGLIEYSHKLTNSLTTMESSKNYQKVHQIIL